MSPHKTKPLSRLTPYIAICAFAAVPWCASQAATDVNEHRAADPRGTVEISNVAGDIKILGWDQAQVDVTGTIGKDVERVEVSGDGSRTIVRVVLPEHQSGRTDSEAHLVIHVPLNSAI